MDQRSNHELSGNPGASPCSVPPACAGGNRLAPEVQRRQRWLSLAVCLFLAAIIWAVFGQTLHYDFVNFDDNEYVSENPVVAKGLTLEGIRWAFTHNLVANWHPLTVMSYMVDASLYGLKPGGYHLTNVLLHTGAVMLLFVVLKEMTGTLWRSAFVAAVFAIHPLRVESVAWIAERKDVLSGVFFMLTLWAYIRYVQKSTALPSASPLQRFALHASRCYWLAVVFFALGLMSKPMLVTLPCILILLDYWPLQRLNPSTLQRFNASTLPRLLVEKVPLLALSGAACLAMLFAQTGAIRSFEALSLPVRVGNALISYVAYLDQMLWPSGLAVFYPFAAGHVGTASVALSLIALAGISAGVFVLRRQRPYLVTGWLWYLIMLLPVIGLIQVGDQARADRYTYLPQIGLYVLLTWAAADLCAGWRHRRVALGGGAAIILTALILCARAQTGYWRNSETLWKHALACTSGNWVAHNNLGTVLLQDGAVEQAISQFQEALQIRPSYAEARNNLGNALLRKGSVDEAMVQYQKALEISPGYAAAHNDLGLALFQKGALDEAMVQYQKALEINPGYAEAHYNLGNVLLTKGAVDDAIFHFQKALQINPDFAGAHNNLGLALLKKGALDEAMVHFQKALEINPGNAEAQNNLGNALRKQGRVDEGMAHYQRALQINPDYAEALNNLAWVLATCPQASLRNGNQAVTLAQRANQLTGDGNPVLLCTLAAAYAEAGRFPEAVATAQRALQLAESHSNPALAGAIRSQLKLYQAGLPFHENQSRN